MKYNNPTTGCYLEQANYNIDELNRRVIGIAVDFGWELDAEAQAVVDAYDNRDDDDERSDGPDLDLVEQLEWIAEEAIDWLNEQEGRSYLYWAHNGEAGAFGLWPDIDGAKEDVGFVSSKQHEYPPADYRGEWLHVNDHGNVTLYCRNQDGTDTEIWSIV